MQVNDKLSKVITDMETIFGLHGQGNLAIQDFREVRTLAVERFSKMSSNDKKVFNSKLVPSLEALSFLAMQCGYHKITMIDVSALAPVDASVKMFSIYATVESLSANSGNINTVIDYFSNKLVRLDEETLQNKNGVCYRLQRLFVLANLSGSGLGCSIIANFILFNLKGKGV